MKSTPPDAEVSIDPCVIQAAIGWVRQLGRPKIAPAIGATARKVSLIWQAIVCDMMPP